MNFIVSDPDPLLGGDKNTDPTRKLEALPELPHTTGGVLPGSLVGHNHELHLVSHLHQTVSFHGYQKDYFKMDG